MRVRQFCSDDDIRLARTRSPVGDVVAHRAAKKHRVLQHETDLVAQPLQLEFTHVDTIDKHASRARIVETRDQAHYCGLAATRGTDDAYQLAGSDVEVHVAEHWYRGIITEGHVVKGDRAFDG